MTRIGIIGSDSSHADRFSELCNLQDAPGHVEDAEVVAIWGQDPERTAEVAEKGRITRVVDEPDDMLGEIDAAMVVLRHGGLHLEYSLPFIRAGVPTFVDKPFATTVEDAREMVRAARRQGTPLTSFSTLRYAPRIREFIDGLEAVGPLTAGVSAGPGDVHSEYGGFIFYGIHAIELMQEAFGTGARRVSAVHHAGNLVATVIFEGDPVVSLQVLGNAGRVFHVAAYGKNGADAAVLDQEGCYPAGLGVFLDMVRTGKEPIPHEHMIEAVAVGAAVEASLASGRGADVKAGLG
jgi:predicted dehydrogenase